MVGGSNCGDLGYDLGYLRHGSFGPGLRAMTRRAAARACWMRWPGLAAVCLVACRCGALWGLPNQPGRLPVSPVDPGVQFHFAVLAS